jgi:hypothetical protein
MSKRKTTPQTDQVQAEHCECERHGQRCQEKIELPDGSYWYCTRLARHEGRHVACVGGSTHDVFNWEDAK